MAVTKRARFEVLKRDNYTCRYCRSIENALTIDHVTPVALGGSDSLDNLVAACRDCNAGKSSTSPDAPLVDDVQQDAIRWSGAIKEFARMQSADRRKRTAYGRKFMDQWTHYRDFMSRPFPMSDDWQNTIEHFHAIGLPIAELEDAVRIAATNRSLHRDNVWRYMCGICWNKVTAMQDGARAILEAEGS